jgi:hypothetical protein
MRTHMRFIPCRLGLLAAMVLVQLLAPAAASATDAVWHGLYFANMELAGNPALVRDVEELNYNWGWNAPGPGLPADHFSARWTRKVDFPAGVFRFSVLVDDGVRLFVDNRPVIDQWRVTAPITYTSSITMTAGTHSLELEYYENTERAMVHVWWDQSSMITPNDGQWHAPDHPGSWQGSYYANRNMTGDPKFLRDDALIYFDWGSGSPSADLGTDDFSVRWHRLVRFNAGHYLFKVNADDGVRVWLDWQAIIDEWHDAEGRTYQVDLDVTAGDHEMVVEYYERSGDARVQLEWGDTQVNWIGNLFTCMYGRDSWVKIFRLSPANVWEDMRAEGYGPMTAGGELTLFGLPISPLYGWDGQPYKVELWISGQLVRTEGDVLAGQRALALQPNQWIRTSWACGAGLPKPGPVVPPAD